MLFLLFSVFSGDFLRFSAQNSGCGLAIRRRRRSARAFGRVAVRRGGAAANCAVRRTAKYTCVSRNPRQERFRGRSRDCAKSDAFGTFEAIKRSPIFNASSLRPPLVRNRSCRGFGCRVCISLKTYLRRLRGSHRRCEPPKIAPLCGALTRVYFCDSASCAGRSLAPAAAISGPNFVMNCGYIARGPYGRRRARRSNAGP